MTADLDLSPEAVERLADRLNGIYRIPITDGLGPAGGDEPDNPNEFVRRFPPVPIQQQAAATLRALSAENARLRAERDEQGERAEEAESEITRAQEQVSAEFEGDCWKAMRNLLDRTGFDWPAYGDDGVTADDAHQWIVEELDRLEAERDAAWQAGAEATYAVKVAADGTCSFKCPRCGQRHTHGAPEREQVAEHRLAHCANAEVHHPKGYFIVAASRPRALPLPGQPKEGAP